MEDALDTLEAIEALENLEDLGGFEDDLDGLDADPLQRELVEDAVEEVLEEGQGVLMEGEEEEVKEAPRTISPVGKVFTAQQNVAQLQFVIPRLGQGFSVKVTFRRNHKRK